MWSSARQVAAGDTVIVWLTREQVQPLVVTPGKDFNTKFGNFRQADFVGVPYGSKVPSRTGKGFVHLLRPTPELWTVALPHRTQILYLADIAFITSFLNIRPGSRVIEAGTGSASFSHSVARTIGARGHLWSYEFHEARFLKAREEFARHGMADVVTLQHRNVCKDGFTNVDEVDSVFLDLPAPWDAVEHAKRALRKDRVTRICCFSPCMEQVLRTVSALNEAGFTEITMYETLLRPIEVFQAPVLPGVGGVAEKLKASEARREEKRLRQIAQNKAQAAAAKADTEAKGEAQVQAGKRKREEEVGEGEGEGEKVEVVEDMEEGSSKRAKVDVEEDVSRAPTATVKEEDVLFLEENEEEEQNQNQNEDEMDVDAPSEATPSNDPSKDATTTTTTTTTPATPLARRNQRLAGMPGAKINVSKALPEVRGHTSYLTFACLVPVAVHAPVAPTPETDLEASSKVVETEMAAA